MMTRVTRRKPGPVALTLLLTLALLLAGCAEEGAEAPATAATTTAATSTTQPASTTEAVTTSTEATTTTEAAAPAVSEIELLSGMLQGLLTTEEMTAAIGVTLVDQGRQVTPPGVSRYSDFLCPEGQALLGRLLSAANPQVAAEFLPEGEASHSAWVSESLLYEGAGQDAGAFATLVSAIDACAGSEAWQAPAGQPGQVSIQRLDLAPMGEESYSFRISLNEGTGDATWLEVKGIAVRIGPGVVEVTANMVHGAPEPFAIGDGGLRNIAEAALAKVEEGLADSEAVAVTAAEPEEILALIYGLAGLLTTEEIGGGWVDQGRIVVPPGSEGQGFARDVLCPEGQAIYAPIGSGLDQQVFTSYRREGSPSVMEFLSGGSRDQLAQDFAAEVSALQACFDRDPWETEEAGTLRMHALDLPALGAQSIAYYVGPGETPGADPWVELQVVSILVTDLDPGNDNSVVVSIAVSTIHDPAGEPAEVLDLDELIRIAEAAVGKLAFPA